MTSTVLLSHVTVDWVLFLVHTCVTGHYCDSTVPLGHAAVERVLLLVNTVKQQGTAATSMLLLSHATVEWVLFLVNTCITVGYCCDQYSTDGPCYGRGGTSTG